MVLSLITLAATVPLVATSTIQLQEQSQQKHDESELALKTEKCHLKARPSQRMSAHRHQQLQDMQLVLHDGYIFLEPTNTTDKHPLTGYLLPYADRGYDGLVSTINADNMLNWIFIDRRTLRIRYGVRADAESELTGPMSLVRSQEGEEWRIACRGWEGFVAVRKASGRMDDVWALYFDLHDDGLAELGPSRDVVEVELVRAGLEEQTAGDQPD